MTLKFLGTGTSVGVPQIGCRCHVCTSADPRDRRRRSCVYVRTDRVGFLIDTPPELREACLEYGVSRVDAVLLTHAHMDHIAGFDDIRRFNTLNGTKGPDGKVTGVPMRCWAGPETIEAMHRIFPYVTEKANERGLFRPMIHFTDNTEPFTVGDVRVESFPVEHSFPCRGYLLEHAGRRVGYVCDCHELSDAVVERLRGVDLMVINCLRERPHPTHLHLERTLSYLSRIAPKRALTVHMCHDLSHAELLAKLPAGVEPAYDGLEIEP